MECNGNGNENENEIWTLGIGMMGCQSSKSLGSQCTRSREKWSRTLSRLWAVVRNGYPAPRDVRWTKGGLGYRSKVSLPTSQEAMTPFPKTSRRGEGRVSLCS